MPKKTEETKKYTVLEWAHRRRPHRRAGVDADGRRDGDEETAKRPHWHVPPYSSAKKRVLSKRYAHPRAFIHARVLTVLERLEQRDILNTSPNTLREETDTLIESLVDLCTEMMLLKQ